MSRQDTPLIDSTLLFDFEIPLRRQPWSPNKKRGPLPEDCLLPHFGGLDGQHSIAKVWGAWSESGLCFDVEVQPTAKLTEPKNRLSGLNGLHLWIDTRHDLGNHRATQYCHQFHFPEPQRNATEPPKGKMQFIQRAISFPPQVDPAHLFFDFIRLPIGYRMQIGIAASALHGFSPSETEHLGLFYEVLLYDHFRQSLSVSADQRFSEDPSFWCRAVLEK